MSDSHLSFPVKITVCRDGFVSIWVDPKDRRLGAALPCYSVATVDYALSLIKKVCELKPCRHGGETGILIEPHAPDWDVNEDVTQAINKLTEKFVKASGGKKQ